MRAKFDAVQPVLMVGDVEAAIAFYERLGFSLAFRDTSGAARYAGIRRDSAELHLQWHDSGEWNRGGDRPTYRFVVPEIEALFEEFSALVPPLDMTELLDTPWGTREFHVRDPDGNGLQFYRDAPP